MDSGHSHAGHGGVGDIPWGWLITAVIIAVAVGGYLLVMVRAQHRLGQAWSRARLASWITGGRSPPRP